jgi:DNA-binding LacI/PurR family transcriptional regulator
MTVRPTIQDVANLAGVHPATVSRALDPRLEGRIAAPIVTGTAVSIDAELEVARELGETKA